MGENKESRSRRKMKLKYIFGQTVKYKGELRKVSGIRFEAGGVMYKLTGLREWIREKDIGVIE